MSQAKKEENAGERPRLAPYVPYVESSEAMGRPWYGAVLEHYAYHGGLALAAAHAGVHRSTVADHLARDARFAAELEAARAYYVDLLEWESVDLARRRDNPLPYFARLKAELPSRYIDKHASVNLTVSTDATAEEATALLAQMVRELTPAGRQRLDAAVASGASPAPCAALPMPSDPEEQERTRDWASDG